jgi:hypothetical protein
MLSKSVVGAGKIITWMKSMNTRISDDHGLNLEIPELRDSAQAISDPSLQSIKKHAITMTLLFACTIMIFFLSFAAGRAAHANIQTLQAKFHEKEESLVSSLTAATISLEQHKVETAKKVGEAVASKDREKAEAVAEKEKEKAEELAAKEKEKVKCLKHRQDSKGIREELTKLEKEKAKAAENLEEQVAAAKKQGATLLEQQMANAAKILEVQVAAAKREGVEGGKSSCRERY